MFLLCHHLLYCLIHRFQPASYEVEFHHSHIVVAHHLIIHPVTYVWCLMQWPHAPTLFAAIACTWYFFVVILCSRCTSLCDSRIDYFSIITSTMESLSCATCVVQYTVYPATIPSASGMPENSRRKPEVIFGGLYGGRIHLTDEAYNPRIEYRYESTQRLFLISCDDESTFWKKKFELDAGENSGTPHEHFMMSNISHYWQWRKSLCKYANHFSYKFSLLFEWSKFSLLFEWSFSFRV